MTDAAWTAIAAVGAAAFTALGSWYVTWRHDRRTDRAGKQAELASAVNDVLSLSFEVTLRSQEWSQLIAHYSSPWTRVDILLGLEARPSLPGLFESMIATQTNLNAAVSRLWLHGGAELIGPANAVALRVADVMEGMLAFGKLGSSEREVSLKLEALMGDRQVLVGAARSVLGQAAVVLSAVTQAPAAGRAVPPARRRGQPPA